MQPLVLETKTLLQHKEDMGTRHSNSRFSDLSDFLNLMNFPSIWRKLQWGDN